MRRWLLLLLLCCTGCATERTPYHVNLAERAALPLPEGGPNVDSQLLKRTDEQSIHLVRLRGSLPRHHHNFHDETVVVLRGTGKMQLGTEVIDIAPGTVLHIPSGVRHSVTIDAGKQAAAISIFTPPFDGKDRVMGAEGRPRPGDPFEQGDERPVGTRID